MNAEDASEMVEGRRHNVRVHINRVCHESPSRTEGEALYALGTIPPGHQLYREVEGDEEDEPIENGSERLHLREDEHFYSEPERHKGFTIIVNARPETVHAKRLTYEEVVVLAYPTPPPGNDIVFLVSYYNGPKANPEGGLVAGGSVKVKNGMVFNVKVTNRA